MFFLRLEVLKDKAYFARAVCKLENSFLVFHGIKEEFNGVEMTGF